VVQLVVLLPATLIVVGLLLLTLVVNHSSCIIVIILDRCSMLLDRYVGSCLLSVAVDSGICSTQIGLDAKG
jgi:hypothetical protein